MKIAITAIVAVALTLLGLRVVDRLGVPVPAQVGQLLGTSVPAARPKVVVLPNGNQASAPTTAPTSAPTAEPQVIYVTATPEPQSTATPEPVGSLPTAIINAPTPITVVVPDTTKPLRFAEGSDARTPVPTFAPTPTAYPIADNVRFPADARCVEARRDDGWYRYCDSREMAYGARLSVADLVRTGRVAGVKAE